MKNNSKVQIRRAVSLPHTQDIYATWGTHPGHLPPNGRAQPRGQSSGVDYQYERNHWRRPRSSSFTERGGQHTGHSRLPSQLSQTTGIVCYSIAPPALAVQGGVEVGSHPAPVWCFDKRKLACFLDVREIEHTTLVAASTGRPSQ